MTIGAKFFENKIEANRKVERAKKEADLYTNKKLPPILTEINNILKDQGAGELLPGTILKLEKLIGSQIALAHGVGFMLGLEKRKLYNASGKELL